MIVNHFQNFMWVTKQIKDKQVSLRIPSEFYEDVKAQADNQGIPTNQLIRDLLYLAWKQHTEVNQ